MGYDNPERVKIEPILIAQDFLLPKGIGNLCQYE